MERTIEVATVAGESLVGLLGDPAFYSRFGFVAAADMDVLAPVNEWGENFQVLALAESPPRGVFEYPKEFLV